MMDMIKMNSGKLRAIGYDEKARLLQVQMDDGTTLQYSGVGDAVWQRLRSASSAWSYYRDNIEDEFAVLRVQQPASPASKSKNPLDDLFGP